MKSSKNVALNVSRLSVPQLINRAKQISDSVAANPGVFTNPSPSISVLNSSINAFELAWNDAENGGKKLVALMHDKKRTVIKNLKLLATYVEYVADGDEEIIHLASLTVKPVGIKIKPDFEVFLPDDLGAVGLKCKARKKTLYRWEYCKDPMGTNNFIVDGFTSVANSFIGNLDSNVMYWFRVVLIDETGDHPLAPKCIIPL